MSFDLTNEDLAKACYILFGPLFNFSKNTLDYIQTSGIKKAYRDMAKRYHPDKLIGLKTICDEDHNRFNDLNNAYRFLLEYKKKNKNIINNNFYSDKDIFKNKKKDFFYTGLVPGRKLRLGEYLYYTKNISWYTLIDAIVTQYKNRPRIGDICKELNYINNEEFNKIIKEIKYTERFGETAIRLGYLNFTQLLYTLAVQKKYNNPFGKYFIDRELFNSEEMDNIFKENLKHNLKVNKKVI